MLPFPALQQKLAFEIQSQFTKQVFEAQKVEDLSEPAKDLIIAIANLCLPDSKVVFENKLEEMPQE